jgi:hypothetical protein
VKYLPPRPDSVKDFASSVEASYRRRLRDTVRKSNLTRAERDVVLAFLNHWFVHRHKGAVHPGRKKLCKLSGASLPTVKRALMLLRDWEVVTAESHLEGRHGMATEYTVNEARLNYLCSAPKAALKAWREARISPKARNIGGSNEPTLGRVKMNPRNKHCTVIPFRIQGEAK